MREQVESTLFPELADVVASGMLTPKGRNDARKNAKNAAGHRALAYKYSWVASALLFAIGGIVALVAVVVPRGIGEEFESPWRASSPCPSLYRAEPVGG